MSERMSDLERRLAELLRERLLRADPSTGGRALARLVETLEADAGAPHPPPAEHPKNGSGRWDHDLIERHIPENASVLDLGCGSGTLLRRLMRSKRVRGQGIELDAAQVMECVGNGVPVFQTNLDDGLAGFPDASFDFVVLEETVQTLHRPVVVLSEMVRVGRQGIVTFPNFAHWQVRLDLALNGRMPITGTWPFAWFESPNIRPLTLHDFQTAASEHGIRIVEGHALSAGDIRLLEPDDNLFAEQVMLVIEKS